MIREDDDMEDESSDDLRELFEHHRLKVDKGQDLIRIDKFLFSKLPKTTRTRIQNACDAGLVMVNDKPVKSNYRIKPFDEISIMLTTPPREIEIKAENIPLNIVYEDDYLAVINKKPGMVMHPAYGNYAGTLVNALAWHFKDLPISRTKLNNDLFLDRPGLVHRIDKNTSGLIVIAKTELSLMNLAGQIYERKMDRTYQAIVWGEPKDKSGTVIANVGRDVRDRKIMAAFPAGSEMGKHAVTHYRLLENLGYVSLVECKLETGRTHQIRVHMKSIGHPIFNDWEYGGNEILRGERTSSYRQFIHNCFELCPRHALHAKTLGFVHPVSGKKLLFDSELPDDLQGLIKKWRTYMKSKG